MSKVVILGAGVVGAAIAYELSLLPDLEITVLERDQAATGATGAALGVLMGIISQKTKGRAWTLRLRSMARFPQLLAELAAAGQPVPHNPHGILKLVRDPEALDKGDRLRELRHSSGFPLEIWTKEQVSERYPQVDVTEVVGGIFSPQDFQVQPIPLTQSLLQVAQQNGVQCHFGCAASAVVVQGQTCTGVQTPQGDFACDWLIVSAGLGSLELTQPLAASLQMQPVLGQAFHVKVPTDALNPDASLPVVSFEDVHVVPLGGGEFWVGATVEFPDEMDFVQANEQLMAEVWQRAIAFYPVLQQAEILRHWSGQRPRPVGHSAPIVEPLADVPNIMVATGHYRNGVLLAPATALMVRDWLLANR